MNAPERDDIGKAAHVADRVSVVMTPGLDLWVDRKEVAVLDPPLSLASLR